MKIKTKNWFYSPARILRESEITIESFKSLHTHIPNKIVRNMSIKLSYGN